MRAYLAVGALLAMAAPAGAQTLLPFQNPVGPNPTENTMAFRAEALRSDAFEIESSRMALAKSNNRTVRRFAQRMIQDHTATTNALLPPNASLNRTGNVVSTQEAGLFDNGVFSVITAPLTVPVDFLGNTFGGRPDANHRVVLDDRRAAMLQQLNGAQGPREFTRLYADQQVRAHQEAVALYAGYAQNGDEDAARTFATQALPGLQDHLGHAVSIDERYGSPAANSF